MAKNGDPKRAFVFEHVSHVILAHFLEIAALGRPSDHNIFPAQRRRVRGMSIPFTPQVSALLSGALPVDVSPPRLHCRLRDPFDRYEWPAALSDELPPPAAAQRSLLSSALQSIIIATTDLDGSVAANVSSVTIPLSSIEVVSATNDEGYLPYEPEGFEDPGDDDEWVLRDRETPGMSRFSDAAHRRIASEVPQNVAHQEPTRPTSFLTPSEPRVTSSVATPTTVSSESASSSTGDEDVSLTVSPDVSFEEEALHRRMAAFRAEIDHMYLEVEKESHPYISPAHLHTTPSLSAPPPLSCALADARRQAAVRASSRASTATDATVHIRGDRLTGPHDSHHALHPNRATANRAPPGTDERAAFLRYTSTSQQHALAERARNICKRLQKSEAAANATAASKRVQRATAELHRPTKNASKMCLVKENKKLHLHGSISTATGSAAPVSSTNAPHRAADHAEIPVSRSPSSTLSTLTTVEQYAREDHLDSSLSPVFWKESVPWTPVQQEQRPPVPLDMLRQNERGRSPVRNTNIFRVLVRVTPTGTGT